MDGYALNLARMVIKGVFVFLAGVVFSLPYTALSMLYAARHFTKFAKYLNLVGEEPMTKVDRFLEVADKKYQQLKQLVLSDEDQVYEPIFQLGVGIGVLGILAGSAFVGFAPFVMAGHVPQIVTAVAAGGELSYSFLTFLHCYVAVQGLHNVKEGLTHFFGRAKEEKPDLANERTSTVSNEVQSQCAELRQSMQNVKADSPKQNRGYSPLKAPSEEDRRKMEKVIQQVKKRQRNQPWLK